MEMGLWQVIKIGGVATWIIGVCSIAAVAVAIERGIALWRFSDRSRALAEAVTRALFRGDIEDGRAVCERSASPAADVFLAAFARPASGRNGSATMDRIAATVDRERQQLNLKLRARLWILGTIGAVAPFIGLYGTVVGIMRAFNQMAKTGQGGFAVVAAGISEALITTAGGIAVAVEAVILFNYLNTHVQKLALQFRLLTEEFLEIVADVKPYERPPPAAAEPGRG